MKINTSIIISINYNRAFHKNSDKNLLDQPDQRPKTLFYTFEYNNDFFCHSKFWPALERPNLTVLDNTMTDRILFDGSTAGGIGVSNFRNSEEKAEIFGEEIILSGGAINSPQLLQLSGVGNSG